jgi:hypothetical protein
LRADLDGLLERHGFLTDDAELFFNPLAQPIVTFPLWVAAAVGFDRVERAAVVLDVVESTVMGYLYVRVHDDLMDEGVGEPTSAMLVADAFLVRHNALLATHVSSARFWDLHERTAAAYSEAMLLEREVSRREAEYGADEFDRVLDRSQPLVLPGAALLDLADQWSLLPALQRFIHHTVRAGQLVDDTIDCEHDLAAGNHTWVVRLLNGEDGRDAMIRNLITDGIDNIVAMVLDDLDKAGEAASAARLSLATPWLEDRRQRVMTLQERLLRAVLSE